MEIQELARYFSGAKGREAHLVAMKYRTIDLMLRANVDVDTIAQTIGLTKGQVYRLIREYRQPDWYKSFIDRYYDKLILNNEYPNKDRIKFEMK